MKAGTLPMGYNADRLDCGALSARWSDVEKAFDGSLDAAKALHEAVLPKRYWLIEEWDGAWEASIPISRRESIDATSEENPARAWLTVILEALIIETETS